MSDERAVSPPSTDPADEVCYHSMVKLDCISCLQGQIERLRLAAVPSTDPATHEYRSGAGRAISDCAVCGLTAAAPCHELPSTDPPSDERPLPVPSPQDPPADVHAVLTKAVEMAIQEGYETPERIARYVLGDATSDHGVAVVHADVPHGSRAEHAGTERMYKPPYGAGNAYDTPVFRWVAPSVDPKEQL